MRSIVKPNAKTIAKTTGGAKSISLGLLAFVSIAVSGFIALLFYLDQYDKNQLTENNTIDIEKILPKIEPENSTGSKKQENKDINKTKPADEKSDFDFYSLLPKMEVLVPEPEVTTRSAKKELKIESSEKGQYYVQAGAFKDIKAADRMKAGLALLGIQSKIVSVDLGASGVWHRVRVGPFDDAKELSRVRSVMKANNIESILVRVKT
jgi:cell division protein FtsN